MQTKKTTDKADAPAEVRAMKHRYNSKIHMSVNGGYLAPNEYQSGQYGCYSDKGIRLGTAERFGDACDLVRAAAKAAACEAVAPAEVRAPVNRSTARRQNSARIGKLISRVYVRELEAQRADMLAALQALFRECSMVHKYWGDGCNQEQSDAAIADALAAIARVEGSAS